MRVRIRLIALALMLVAAMMPGSSRAQNAPDAGIKVDVSGFRNANGQVRCALWPPSPGFPRDDSQILTHVAAPIRNGEGNCVFAGHFKAADYAVTLFHDEDNSGKFKSNMIGYPLEGYGFSNNVVPVFKAPSFDECKFHYDGSGWKKISIKMIYR